MKSADNPKVDEPKFAKTLKGIYQNRSRLFAPSIFTRGFSFYTLIPIALAIIIVGTIIANIPCVVLNRGVFCMIVSQATQSNSSGEWTQWSNCSSSCGFGKQTRQRYDGTNKKPNKAEMRICEERIGCPIKTVYKYNWNEWSTWSICSQKDCENGTQSRVRQCLNETSIGSSYNNTVDDVFCQPGDAYENKTCYEPSICIAPFVWAAWSLWQPCSTTCESGFQIRVRECVSRGNDTQTVTIDKCRGYGGSEESSQIKNCYSMLPCDATFSWSDWGDWTQCSKTCDTGLQKRIRECKASSGQKVATSRCMPLTSDQSLYTQQKKCTSGAPCGAAWGAWTQWQCDWIMSTWRRERQCLFQGTAISFEHCPVGATSEWDTYCDP